MDTYFVTATAATCDRAAGESITSPNGPETFGTFL